METEECQFITLIILEQHICYYIIHVQLDVRK